MKEFFKAIWPAVLGFVISWIALELVKNHTQMSNQKQEIHQLAVESFTNKFQDMESDINESLSLVDTTDIAGGIAVTRFVDHYLDRTFDLYSEIYDYIKKNDLSDKYPEEYKQLNNLLSRIFESQAEIGKHHFTTIGILKKELNLLHDIVDSECAKAMTEVLKIDPANSRALEELRKLENH